MLYEAFKVVRDCLLLAFIGYINLLLYIPVMYPEDSPAVQFWKTAVEYHLTVTYRVVVYLWETPWAVIELLYIAWILFLLRYFYNKYFG